MAPAAFLFLLCLSLASALNLLHMSADDQDKLSNRQVKDAKIGAVTFGFARHFQNHMVLQRAPQRANIYGFSPTIGQKVTLQLVTVPATRTYSYETTVHQDGSAGAWNFVLDPFAAGITVNIRVDSGGESHNISDVIFGDVWICSGQSNMQMTVFQIDGAAEEIADANNYPNIRVMTVNDNESPTPLNNLIALSESWSRASSASIGHGAWSYFSAVCWLFGKAIFKARHIPIGLVDTDWGGTPVKVWSSPEALAHCGVHHDEPSDQPESYTEYLKHVPLEDTHRLLVPGNSSVLWNSMVHPLLGMTIYGAIWYQGESDSGGVAREKYNCTFPTMIKDWRSNWNRASNGQTSATFPFGFVQVQCAHLRWVADPIVAHTNTTVTLKPNVCHAGEKITGLRYAWSESPCALHRCAIYETSHNLPGPPFISFADFDPNGEPYFTFNHQTHIRN